MLGARRRIWFSGCGALLALLLALGPLSTVGIGIDQVAAQSSADDAEELLAAAFDMTEELDAYDAPSTLDLEQSESGSITLSFLNSPDELIADFYLSFRAEAPRDGDDDPFDFAVYFRDLGSGEPYLNLVFVSSASGAPTWVLFNEEGAIESGEIDEDTFLIEEGTRYQVDVAAIGDEVAFAINDEPIALVDISDNSDPGRIALASGIFGETQIEGSIVETSRISLFDLGGGTGSDDEDVVDDDDTTDDDEVTPDDDEDTTDDDDAPAGDTESADSELYGFSIDFDPEMWELRTITQTEQDYDSLGLENVEVFDFVDGQTQVLMFAGASENSARECVELDLTFFEEISARYDFVGVAEDDDGELVEGETSSGDGYYSVIYLDDNGPADNEFDEPEPITVYVECRPIVDGESLLLIEHYARDADYNDAIDGRVDLLAGIDVSSADSGNEDDEPVGDDDETVEDDEEPVEDDDDQPVDDVITVEIVGDVEGEATVEASGSTRSRITVTVEGADEGALVVVQEGSCDDLAGESAFDVDEIDDQGEASGRVRITPEELDGEYALTIVDADTEDFEEPLGCGDIG